MTILVRCSDPRINVFLDSPETKKELGLENGFALIANTGSVKYFMQQNQMDDFAKQLDILVPHFKADKIVLLNHTDCGFYKAIGQDKEENYLLDLRNVKAELLKIYPELIIDGYLMDTKTGALNKA